MTTLKEPLFAQPAVVIPDARGISGYTLTQREAAWKVTTNIYMRALFLARHFLAGALIGVVAWLTVFQFME